MLSRKTNRFWRYGLTGISIISFLVLLYITGCSKTKENYKGASIEQKQYATAKKIGEIYSDNFRATMTVNTLENLDVIENIVNSLGENGYIAVDSQNQINMVGFEQVVQFCEQVDEKKVAQIIIISVGYNGSFTLFDLKSNGGMVLVNEGYYILKNGCLECMSFTTYPAYSWVYTNEGYLFFEEYHMPGYDGPSGHTAIRVEPLDETCREFNRQYMLLVGYGLNDLFLSNWTETDFGDINFYDLFDIFYPIVYGESNPYVSDENCGVCAVYRIPKEEFEYVITSYFNISSEVLQSKNTYFSEDGSYEYIPRGLEDCERVMTLIADIYKAADKGEASNVVISTETVRAMADRLVETGSPVLTREAYANMGNYQEMEDFLKACINGESGSIIVYEIRYDGGIGRKKYIYDGSSMYVLDASAIWNEKNEPGLAYVSYTRIKEWEYTDKGWFCYELCVPEPPEVSEIVDGSTMIRIKPMEPEYQKLSEILVYPLGYRGNNLLCSNWDVEHLEDLDYAGMYEYLYYMKYQEAFHEQEYSDGIPKEEFEALIMAYIPITREQLREYAAFDDKTQTYPWQGLGCLNYTPNFFGTSVPEVVAIKENEDGTITVTVDAVCEMVLCEESVITHELTVKFSEDGSFQYLGNQILENGLEVMPEYQYRFERG